MPRYVYLAGAIHGVADPQSWRAACALRLSTHNIHALDPLKIETDGLSNSDIVNVDYCAILRSFAVIADVRTPSWGTAMEIAFAKQHGIPVVGWGNPYAPQSKWLLAHLDQFVINWEEAIIALDAYNE